MHRRESIKKYMIVVYGENPMNKDNGAMQGTIYALYEHDIAQNLHFFTCLMK